MITPYASLIPNKELHNFSIAIRFIFLLLPEEFYHIDSLDRYLNLCERNIAQKHDHRLGRWSRERNKRSPDRPWRASAASDTPDS